MKNDVIVFKCLQTLHKLMISGAPEIIAQMFAEGSILSRVKKAWTAQNSLGSAGTGGQTVASPVEDLSKTPVADLIAIYADYLERRIVFLHKVRSSPSSFAACCCLVVWLLIAGC